MRPSTLSRMEKAWIIRWLDLAGVPGARLQGAKSIAATVGEDLRKMPDFWLDCRSNRPCGRECGGSGAGQCGGEARSTGCSRPATEQSGTPRAARIAEAALGRKTEALQQARRAAEMLPAERRCDRWSDVSTAPCRSAGLDWDRDGAFKTLGELVKQPSSPNYGDLKLNPMWDEFRDDPRFDSIVADSALSTKTND